MPCSGAPYPEKAKIKNAHQKATVEVKQIKQAVRFGQACNPNSVWGHIRHFDARHPTAGKVIGFAGIVAVSTLVGFLVDRLVNLIAHATKRKNDKIGLLVGTVIGLVVAITHTAWYFNFPKKLEMRFRCRDFHSDSKTQAGLARANIEDRALPLLMSMYNNAKSSCGVNHEHLIINNADVFDALNYIATYNIGKEKWQNYLIEFNEPPPPHLPYFRANATAERVGIEKGKYYVSKWRTPNEILQRDINAVYSKNFERLNRHFSEIISVMSEHMAKDMSSPNAREEFLEAWNKLTPTRDTSEIGNIVNENISAGKNFRESICKDPSLLSDVQEFIRNRAVRKTVLTTDKTATMNLAERSITATTADKTPTIYEAASVSIHALEENRPQLFMKLKSKIESSYKDPKWSHRSWIGVEELILVGSILSGLRVASIHTMLRNFIGPFIEGTTNAFGPMQQARAAGGSIGMFIPMACIGAAITVLGLGVSAALPPVTPKATHPSGQNSTAASSAGILPTERPTISPLSASGQSESGKTIPPHLALQVTSMLMRLKPVAASSQAQGTAPVGVYQSSLASSPPMLIQSQSGSTSSFNSLIA